jgi:hypothetical protein
LCGERAREPSALGVFQTTSIRASAAKDNKLMAFNSNRVAIKGEQAAAALSAMLLWKTLAGTNAPGSQSLSIERTGPRQKGALFDALDAELHRRRHS